MSYTETTPHQLPDKELFKCVLAPIEDKMPQDLQKFLQGCEIELKRRKLTLKPISK